jgi:hypothetical protein
MHKLLKFQQIPYLQVDICPPAPGSPFSIITLKLHLTLYNTGKPFYFVAKYIMKPSLLLLIILLPAFYPGYSYAQQQSVEDSLQIEQYARQLNRQLVMVSPEDSNKVFTDEIIDSILNSNRMGFGGGKVHYAPDSAFKIYIINGNGGGPYGNEMYESYLHFKNGKRLDPDDDFDPVAGIYKTGPFTYIVIQHYWSRSSSSRSEEYYTLTQFSVEKDVIEYHAISGTDKWPLYYSFNHDKDFNIYTYHNYVNAENTYMRYNPKTNKLSYGFIIDQGQANGRFDDLFPLNKNENQVLQVTGSCVVKNGLLHFAVEKFKCVESRPKE